MSKPIQERIFKSRLTITYRTNITGTVEQERLPFRLLVLGEFVGRSVRSAGLLPDIGKREVHSIKRGTTVDDHLREIVPTWKMPDTDVFRKLQSSLPGRVVLDRVTCAVPIGAIERNEGKAFSLSGTGTFTSSIDDNGMVDIATDVRVGGSLKVDIKDGIVTPAAGEVTILVTGAVSGDYQDPATGKIAGRVTGDLHDAIKIPATAIKMVPQDELEDDADGAGDPKVKVFVVTVEGAQVTRAERTIPFQSLSGFSPDAIAAGIPEVARLSVIKLLLLELQSGLRNRPELRKQLKALLPGYGEKAEAIDAKLAPFEDIKKWALESYPLLSIERKQQAPPPDDGGGTGG